VRLITLIKNCVTTKGTAWVFSWKGYAGTAPDVTVFHNGEWLEFTKSAEALSFDEIREIGSEVLGLMAETVSKKSA